MSANAPHSQMGSISISRFCDVSTKIVKNPWSGLFSKFLRKIINHKVIKWAIIICPSSVRNNGSNLQGKCALQWAFFEICRHISQYVIFNKLVHVLLLPPHDYYALKKCKIFKSTESFLYFVNPKTIGLRLEIQS